MGIWTLRLLSLLMLALLPLNAWNVYRNTVEGNYGLALFALVAVGFCIHALWRHPQTERRHKAHAQRDAEFKAFIEQHRRKPFPTDNKEGGFSAVELMIVLGVGSIIALIVVALGLGGGLAVWHLLH